MSRFGASKFRHAEAKVARREAWIGEIRSSAPIASGNHIKANSCWIAFNTNLAGVLGVVPLERLKGVQREVSHLCCHSDVVTDFDFSAFDQQLLATGSADQVVKVWRLTKSGQDLSSSPSVTLGPEGSQVDGVLFHPTADGVLACAAGRAVKIWDVEHQQILAELEPHQDQVQSLAWRPDGSLLGTSCKDKMLRIFDPRAKPAACQTILAHGSGRDSRLLWVNSEGWFLSVGSNQVREREVRLWDLRHLSSSVASVALDASPRALIPLFDLRTGLLVLAGKGENVLFCYELLPSQPALREVNQCLLETQTEGAAQLPPQALDVMACEVMKVLQLSEAAIVPVSYLVLRKSTQEFHADLFPDSPGNVPATSAQAWWAGDDRQVERVSLRPACQPSQDFHSGCLPSSQQEGRPESSSQVDPEPSVHSSLSPPPATPLTSPSSSGSASSLFLPSSLVSSPSQRSLQSILGRNSSLRHIEGRPLPHKTHITNLRGLSLTTPGECDGFCANRHRVAIPLLSVGGQVAVLELSRPGRLPDTPPPSIQNGASVSDLAWDPFDEQRLAIAGEDAKIRLWQLEKQQLEPEATLGGPVERIHSIRFHPLASSILAASSHDGCVRIWDLRTGRQALRLDGHRDQIFSLAWSPDGCYLATVSRDGTARAFEPRQAARPLQEGPGPEGGRGARVVWVCAGKFLLASGFDSHGERQLSLHQADALAAGPIARLNLDAAPSTLLPFYDPDIGVAFLTGKGDVRVYVYEIITDTPFFLECNSFLSSDPHKGFQFLPKTECDVREVEVARAIRLGQSSVVPVAFRVPRAKKEYFQDDLFPATKVWWEAALPGAAWLGGSNGQHRRLCLQPSNMTPASQAPKEAPGRKTSPSSTFLQEKSEEQKKEELLTAMLAKLGERDDPLPQDAWEGVADEEWD